MAELTIVILMFLAGIVQAQEGIFPIPPEHLYENFLDVQDLNCGSISGSFDKCIAQSPFHIDYSCRYDRTVRPRCYCCGAIYKYIEHGMICTRFCLNTRPSDPKFGMYPIITLPFNWGDAGKPESATLGDGTEYPIIPVNAHLSKLVYGFEKDDDELPIVARNVGLNLADALPFFTKYIFNQLAEGKKDKNILFSPISLHSVMALLYLGSEKDSQTSKELADNLGFIISTDLLKNQYRKITKFMGNQSEIHYDNEIFISKSMQVNEKYAKNVYANFGTNMSYFSHGNIENSLKAINDKIYSKTNKKIENAVTSLDHRTKMLLVNTVLFKANWAFPFEDSENKGIFKTPTGDKKVDMITVSSENIVIQTFKVGTVRNPVFLEMIKIPKVDKNNKISNYEVRIIMGPEMFGKEGLEVVMDLMKRDEGSNVFKENEGEIKYGVNLTMPKFSSKSNLEVSEYLQNMGVKTIFTEDAQLNRIAKGEENLSVTSIRQEVVINVDKTGTEAAAATVVGISFYSAEEPIVKVVDRPFIFIIWDKVNSLPLIVAMINDPTLPN